MKQKGKMMEEIYNATFDRTLVYVLMKCGKVHDVEDILQDTYTELLQVLSEKGPEYIRVPEDFVRQLAKSKVYRYYSEKEREKACVFLEDYEASEQEGMQDTEWEDALINKLTAQEAMEYISEKDELTKEIFYQHYFEDKTLKEIAEKCGVKEATVKNRLYRTLKELSGIKKLLCILAIILFAALLAKPVYSWAEDMISQLLKFLKKEGTTETILLGDAYRTYRSLIDDGVLPEDICININGKEYTIDDLEQIWESNPWLEELDWDNSVVTDSSSEGNVNHFDIYLEQDLSTKGTESEKYQEMEVNPTITP